MAIADPEIISHTQQAHSERFSLSPLLLIATSLLGLAAFFYPFFLPAATTEEAVNHAADAPLIFVLLIGLCVLLLLVDLETHRLDAKNIALLGILVATNSALRPLPGPGGFSLIFVLPMLGGYVFGSGFGFLLGSLSVAVSALFTAGVGPWLPFQMFALGWVGVVGAGLRGPISLLPWPKVERWLLAVAGFVIGLLFGALMNIWLWPFLSAATTDPSQVWEPGSSILATLGHYFAFYLATSLWYDVPRAAGNFILLALLSPALLKLLRRFRDRFSFEVSESSP